MSLGFCSVSLSSWLGGLLSMLFPLIQLLKEVRVLFDRIIVLDDLGNFFLGHFIQIDLLWVHINHLTGVLGLVEVEVVESFHGFDYTRQIHQSGQVHYPIEFDSISPLFLAEVDQLHIELSLLRFRFLLHFLVSVSILVCFRRLLLLRHLS